MFSKTLLRTDEILQLVVQLVNN